MISISPSSGVAAGGISVTITSTVPIFNTNAIIYFGSFKATNIVIVDSQHVTCDTPEQLPGVVPVTVYYA